MFIRKINVRQLDDDSCAPIPLTCGNQPLLSRFSVLMHNSFDRQYRLDIRSVRYDSPLRCFACETSGVGSCHLSVDTPFHAITFRVHVKIVRHPGDSPPRGAAQ